MISGMTSVTRSGAQDLAELFAATFEDWVQLILVHELPDAAYPRLKVEAQPLRMSYDSGHNSAFTE